MLDNNLKFCREDLDLTQEELGYIFGVNRSTVSGWETGKDTMPLRHLIKFCNKYNYSVDYVLGLTRNCDKYEEIPKLDKVKLGKRLKQFRIENNFTQSEIANQCMISQTTYSNYEIGKYLINTLTLYTICKNHNISMDSFLGRKKK